MPEDVTLHGYRFSVYTRVVEMVLQAKGIAHDRREHDPFTTTDTGLDTLHPFGRVPVLSHGGFTLYETAAITRYLDAAFDGPALQPAEPRAAARMNQVIGIIDSYGYWPMVRQVFSQRLFAPLEGAQPDEGEIAAGLSASRKVLSALDAIAAEGLVLNTDIFTLADCHLAPMMDYFTRAAEGQALLQGHPALLRWWQHVAATPIVRTTAPNLTALNQPGLGR